MNKEHKYHLLSFLALTLMAFRGFAYKRVLLVGDSHSNGEYGKILDTYFRSHTSNVTSVAACGSSPSSWSDGTSQFKKTNCGYWRKDSNREIRLKTHEIVSFNTEFAKTHPNLVVFSLGTNTLVSRSSVNQEVLSIKKLTETVKNAGAECLWVGPPDLNKIPFKKNLLYGIDAIKKAAESNGCQFIDSTKLTSYNNNKSSKNKKTLDGIHYGPMQSKMWGEKVVNQIKFILPNLSQAQIHSEASKDEGIR